MAAPVHRREPSKLAIAVTIEARAPGFTARTLKSTLRRLTAHLGLTGRVELAVVDDARIQAVHAEFLDENTSTDVITFEYDPPSTSPPAGRRELRVHGELIVSLETAVREAARRRIDWRTEFWRYVAHGLLHLSGLEDATAAQRRVMRRREHRALRALGLLDHGSPPP